jgi:hypothetical protein
VKSRIPSSFIRFVLACGLSGAALHADWKDEIGFTRLKALGAADLPTATANGLTHVEASNTDPPVYSFLPDSSNPALIGNTIINKSSAIGSGISSHATHVATNFYGTGSLLPGGSTVDVYEAGGWLGSGFLKLSSNNLPGSETRNVQNHSWIGASETSDASATEANHRLDYAIHNQGFVCVVGENNGSSNILPQLLGQGYHTISVGRDDGLHSAGFTNLGVAGRIKPDIVAPSAFPEDRTSWTTPMVAGAAGLLHRKLSDSYGVTGANRARVVKALLLASATKNTVSNWDNTSSRPLDEIYGAGELNLYHAYLALRAGNFSASDSTSRCIRGWAAESVSGNSSKNWFFTIPAGAPATPFCAAMTWHRNVSKNKFSNAWSATLANLNLRLHQANGFTPGSVIAESLSTVDNVELVHQPALPPGNYVIVVQNTSNTATDFALAWHSLPAVTVAATQPVAKELDGQQGQITLTRTGDSTLPLQVPLTIGGSAVPGSHFQALPSSVIIPAGQASASLFVTPVSDSLAQGARTVSVAVAADFALVRDSAQSAVVTIQDKPFDAWRFTNFSTTELANPAIGGETADPDSDGLANLIEYAMGLPPKSPDASPMEILESDGYLAITGVRDPAAIDITWAAQATSTLDAWNPADIDLTDETFTARDTVLMSAADQRFIRLKITRP